MCCKLLAIEALQKPRGVLCTHCTAGVGCGIYPDRPAECARFYCGYMWDPGLGEHWRPSNAKMVLVSEGGGSRIVVHVDAARPGAWRAQPFYADIKRLAAGVARKGGLMLVKQGVRVFAILPDRDQDLGNVRPDQIVATRMGTGANSGRTEILVLEPGDPRIPA
jgi:hypothetical protein